jgi:predicted MFS family arabinose efflux permease
MILPTAPRSGHQRLDWPGALALTVSVTSLLFGLNRGPEAGWASPTVLAGFALVPLAAVAFGLIERRSAAPLLPLRYLRQRNFAFPIGAQVFANFAYLGGFILAPLLLEKVYRYSATDAGLLIIARPIAFSITAPVAGYAAVRVGERLSAVAGGLAVGASMLVFASLGYRSPVTIVIAALVLSGVGLGVASPSIAASVANAVDTIDLGVASATQQLMTQVGAAAGIQILETVQASRQHADGLLGSFSDAYLVGAGACLLAIVCASGMRRDPRDAGRSASVRQVAPAPG